jgi:radical SAM superfamily enzyme YgiQ (UPF0313 family)
MHILLVCPRFPDSLWSFQGIQGLVGVASGQSPIGLATIAALTPSEIEVSIVDENVEPIDYEAACDAVAISCFNVQWARTIEIAAEFKRRGRLVVIGGPYPTLCPERFEGVADVLFVGEAEYTWPRFCRDLLAGNTLPPVYAQEKGKVKLTDSPVPRFDLLSKGKYLYYYVQTTRGCPFQCEFCDIIITDGRRPRSKTVEQVLDEVETIYRLGGRYISFSDANLIANPGYAETLLVALRDFGRRNDYPIQFSAELTLNVARHPRILELLRDSNFESVFVGVESPRTESLVEARKAQNVSGSILENIRTIQSYNLVVIAGMIVGFDNDDVGIFQDMFDFLQEAGIPFTTAGVLFAIEHTPLYERLAREGRLLPYDMSTVQVHGSADLNFTPKQMTRQELLGGYQWMIRALYRYDHYRERLLRALESFGAQSEASRQSLKWLMRYRPGTTARVLAYFLLTRDRVRRSFFLRTLWRVMRRRPSLQKLIVTISYMVIHKHFHEYVERVHGDPENAGCRSPFSLVTEAPARLARTVPSRATQAPSINPGSMPVR